MKYTEELARELFGQLCAVNGQGSLPKVKAIQKFLENLSERFKPILGGTYGGPSISFDNNEFILYRWYDAPVGDDKIKTSNNLFDLICNT